MEILKLINTLSKAVEKNDVAKGCLIGGATAIGTGGLIYIGKKLLEKKADKNKANLNISIE